ncbi:hypothetical protein BGZ94_009420 [Podila epigama]|nr:hypothetical protein BGZ94_009420 [Podila epigama]
MTSHQQRALLIPEILERIFASSNRHHLHALSLVCRQWYRITRRFRQTVLIWYDTLDVENQVQRLNHLHRTHILDCTADIYGDFATDFECTTSTYKLRAEAWKVLRAKIVEQQHIVRHNAERVAGALLGRDVELHKRDMNQSILLDMIPLKELILRGTITLANSILPILPELSSLKTLRLVRISLDQVNLRQILDACPCLLHLEMEPVTAVLTPMLIADPTLELDTSEQSLPRFRLQRLHLTYFVFDQQVLESFLRTMPNLTDLRLIMYRNNPRTDRHNGTNAQLPHYDRTQFLQNLAQSCSNLSAFQLTFACGYDGKFHSVQDPVLLSHENLQEAVQHLPLVEHWSFSGLGFKTSTLNPLQSPIFTRLTTLEITLNPQSSAASVNFHAILCLNDDMANLLHLKILGITYNSELLRTDMPISGESQDVLKPYWRCRNLRTLHIHLVDGQHYSKEDLNTRRPIAYIVKVCPHLRDLWIKKDSIDFTLTGGLCQLTELEDLERLALDVRELEPVSDKALRWIRQTFSVAPSRIDKVGNTWQWIQKSAWAMVTGRSSDGGRTGSGGTAGAAEKSLKTGTESHYNDLKHHSNAHGSSPRHRPSTPEPLTVKEAKEVGGAGEVIRILMKLDGGGVCWSNLESFKVQIHWTFVYNLEQERLQKRLPHVLCRVGTKVLVA